MVRKSSNTAKAAKTTQMDKAKKQKAIEELNKYMWSLKGKCPMITEVNRDLIMQYCQFTVLGSAISAELADGIDDMLPLEAKSKLEHYQAINKITLSLYKTLGLGDIKDDTADLGNKFLRAAQEQENEGDF